MLVCLVLIISPLESQSKFQMFTLAISRLPCWCTTDVYQHSIFTLGSVNVWETFKTNQCLKFGETHRSKT